ncbi:MAG TPA: hypothetical protein VK158_03235 [Acidobacteriota bacterium]|nr:hypothetical protein [Acidobacteriota bacterium]
MSIHVDYKYNVAFARLPSRGAVQRRASLNLFDFYEQTPLVTILIEHKHYDATHWNSPKEFVRQSKASAAVWQPLDVQHREVYRPGSREYKVFETMYTQARQLVSKNMPLI